MKHVIQNDMKIVNVNIDQMQVFVMINSVEITVNANVNPGNYLAKVDVIIDFFAILVYANMNVINHVMLENIQIIKIVDVERS